tara:strand:- start:158 stop:1135 length:978 start_codon:yes stop_codon:yes gene_type:complete
MNKSFPFTPSDIETARSDIGPYIRNTPVWQWQSHLQQSLFGENTEIFLKLELFQHTGCFKPRGALTVMNHLSPDELQKGVITASGGNHAIAVAYAANVMKVPAKVVVPKTIDKILVKACQAYGADVVYADNILEVLDVAERIRDDEGLSFIHPFEGPYTTLGQSTLGLEFCQQIPNLDAVIVAIGGGGLCSCILTAVKQLQPNCKVYGVEPEGAPSMARSITAGSPQKLTKVNTIADSLAAPFALPYGFAICKEWLDDIVLVDDNKIRDAMRILFEDLKLAVEPAGATGLAAMLTPLKSKLQGKRVGLLICGSNISVEKFSQLMQ